MDLTELQEELGEDLFTKLSDAGYVTARDVLDAKRIVLLEIEGLDDDMIDKMRAMIKDELERAVIDEESEPVEEEKD